MKIKKTKFNLDEARAFAENTGTPLIPSRNTQLRHDSEWQNLIIIKSGYKGKSPKVVASKNLNTNSVNK